MRTPNYLVTLEKELLLKYNFRFIRSCKLDDGREAYIFESNEDINTLNFSKKEKEKVYPIELPYII